MNHEHPASLADALRAVMRRVPSPVTVVTAVYEGQAVGATIGSFTSVSLTPPLISFNLQHGSVLRAALEADAPFAVHLLGEDQADLALRFARPDVPPDARFAGLPDADPDGVPRLPCLARVRGRCHLRVSAGDHLLVIADVLATEGPSAGEPLVYLDRAFGTVARGA
jgi:3-hydroxy-9,10-secoandrosta-1,3,5(10)-triene-9,17-dione monooxygenase reductase component